MKKVKKYKISRRLRAPIFEKCATQKFVLREQSRAPKKRRRQQSDYSKQLEEKQRVRFMYSISEKTLKNYVKKSVSNKAISSEDALIQALERRLDNVVYQLGISPTRRMARQLVSHGHFTINNRKITIPSYQVTEKDKVGIREGSLNTELFKLILSNKTIKPRIGWLSWDNKKNEGSIVEKPILNDSIFSIPSVIEYYSR